MTNVWRVLRWSLPIGGGGLGFWYLKQSTRNQNHSELPFTPSDRLRALLGFDEHDRDQGPSVERWRIPQSPLVAQIRETTDERPGSFTTYDLDPDPSFVDPMEAIGPLELIEDVFPGPFREEIEVFDPFEPNAPPEHELDDHPPEVPVANVAEVLAREEGGNVAEPAGGDVPAPDQDASEDATGSAGENSGSLAAEGVPDPEVSNVIGAADGDMRADDRSGSNENRDSRDEAGSSGDDDENMIVRLGGLLSEARILSPPPQPHREARSEESDDDQS